LDKGTEKTSLVLVFEDTSSLQCHWIYRI